MHTSNNPWKVVVCLAVVVCGCATIQSAEQQVSAFEEIRNQIEKNCLDCYGASKDELISAVRDLEAYLRQNPGNQEAQRVLARAYGQ